MTQEEKLYNELIKEVKRANQRILRIERRFGEESWAVKQLRNRLDSERIKAWTKSSRIRLNKKMDIIQLRAVKRATESFLKSKTSTIKGIKAQIKKIKKSFQTKLEISEEEAEVIYQSFSEDLINWITKMIEPSEFWSLIWDAKRFNQSEDEFLEFIEQYIDYGNDETIVERLKLIYGKYV